MKTKIIVGVLIIIILLIGVGIFMKSEKTEERTTLKEAEGISIVPTMNDTITSDSLWCGTFQLTWNDLKNEYVKKDIEFNPQIEMAKNLNKSDFTTEMISEDSYYKKSGEMTKKLKEEIEKGIKDKFNETSDILNSLDWKDETEDLILYAMLKKEFEFNNEFDKLDNGIFNEKYENIRYFGINSLSDNSLREQIDVLYYHDMEDFAVTLNTKQNEQVIICRTVDTKSFQETYDNLNERAKSYEGERKLKNSDVFKMPELKVASKRKYVELVNKDFEYANGEKHVITDALQTIEFELDSKGGKVKSESSMIVSKFSSGIKESRQFVADGTFYIFLKEKDKSSPYLAARIDNITKFQK